MNNTFKFAILGALCLFVVMFAGCVGYGPGNQTGQPLSPTPTETAVQSGNLVVTEAQNTATVYMNKSRVITVKLSENPTTGYQWNLTTTPGLQILKDSYIPSDTTGKLVGSGGTRTWDISTEVTGEQKIHAVYQRSWEQTASNETTFGMTVMVI